MGWTSQSSGGGANATQLQGVGISATSPTNGQVLTYDSGSGLWTPAAAGGGSSIYAFPGNPTSPSWAWLNQTGASVTASAGTLLLTSTTNGGQNLQGRMIASPSTPYQIYATIQPILIPVNFNLCGVFFYGSGKLHFIGINYQGGWTSSVTQYSSVTAYSSTLYIQAFSIVQAQAITFVIEDDGANRNFYLSGDGGFTKILLYTEVNNTYFTTTNVGFFVDSNGSNVISRSNLLNWGQTT